jgi:hypothetical protein
MFKRRLMTSIPSSIVSRTTPPVTFIPREELSVRLVWHIGKHYIVVGKDKEFSLMTDVWEKDIRTGETTCVWSHRWNKPPTERVKNVCGKAARQSYMNITPP